MSHSYSTFPQSTPLHIVKCPPKYKFHLFYLGHNFQSPRVTHFFAHNTSLIEGLPSRAVRLFPHTPPSFLSFSFPCSNLHTFFRARHLLVCCSIFYTYLFSGGSDDFPFIIYFSPKTPWDLPPASEVLEPSSGVSFSLWSVPPPFVRATSSLKMSSNGRSPVDEMEGPLENPA